MGIAYNTSVVRDGLGLNVDFANPKSISGAVLTDISNNGISISLTNPSANTMVITNGYAEFNPADIDGTATYYTISNSYFNTIKNEISIETAMYVYGNFGNDQWVRGVSSRTTETSSPLGFTIKSNNVLTAEANTTNGWKSGGVSSSAIAYNRWIYITQTTSVTDNAMKTYINGVLLGSVSLAGETPNGGNGFLIGRGFYGGIRNYNGRVGFLRVYSKRLVESEVKQNFEAVRGRYGI